MLVFIEHTTERNVHIGQIVGKTHSNILRYPYVHIKRNQYLLQPSADFLQISLSNPLTIPVSFRVETSGPFVINPFPPKKRLNSGKTSFETQLSSGGGGGDDARCQGRRRQQSQLADNNIQATRSPKRRRAGDGASCANRDQRTASVMDTQDHNQHQKQHHPERQHRRTKDLISLLPGQNRQLEVVFLPSRASAEMSECLKSSFSPGTEVILRHLTHWSGPQCWSW